MCTIRDDGYGRFVGTDSDGNEISFEKSNSGSYERKTDSGGYDIIEDSDGTTIAYVEGSGD